MHHQFVKNSALCDSVNRGHLIWGNRVWTTSAHFKKWSAYRGGCFAFPNGHATFVCGEPLLVGYQSKFLKIKYNNNNIHINLAM
jgi:hypothetical protein